MVMLMIELAALCYAHFCADLATQFRVVRKHNALPIPIHANKDDRALKSKNSRSDVNDFTHNLI